MSYRKLPLVVSLLAGVALCALGTDASAVNVPPTIAGLANKNQAWNAPAPPIASVGTVVDTDSPDFNTGRLTVKMVAIAPSTVLVTDKLSIRNQGVAAGLIGFTGVAPFTVTYSGVAIGTANAAFVTSTTNFVITFNSGAATPTAVTGHDRRCDQTDSDHRGQSHCNFFELELEHDRFPSFICDTPGTLKNSTLPL